MTLDSPAVQKRNRRQLELIEQKRLKENKEYYKALDKEEAVAKLQPSKSEINNMILQKKLDHVMWWISHNMDKCLTPEFYTKIEERNALNIALGGRVFY